jgi:hypothetical protein
MLLEKKQSLTSTPAFEAMRPRLANRDEKEGISRVVDY